MPAAEITSANIPTSPKLSLGQHLTTLSPIPPTLPTAIEAHQTGNLARAESLYLELIQQSPKHPDPKNLLGVLYRPALSLSKVQQSRFSDAIPLIQSAIALAPQTPDYHFNLAEALRATNQFEAALAFVLHHSSAVELEWQRF